MKFPDTSAQQIENPEIIQLVRQVKWFTDLSTDSFVNNDVRAKVGGLLNNALYVFMCF